MWTIKSELLPFSEHKRKLHILNISFLRESDLFEDSMMQEISNLQLFGRDSKASAWHASYFWSCAFGSPKVTNPSSIALPYSWRVVPMEEKLARQVCHWKTISRWLGVGKASFPFWETAYFQGRSVVSFRVVIMEDVRLPNKFLDLVFWISWGFFGSPSFHFEHRSSGHQDIMWWAKDSLQKHFTAVEHGKEASWIPTVWISVSW